MAKKSELATKAILSFLMFRGLDMLAPGSGVLAELGLAGLAGAAGLGKEGYEAIASLG